MRFGGNWNAGVTSWSIVLTNRSDARGAAAEQRSIRNAPLIRSFELCSRSALRSTSAEPSRTAPRRLADDEGVRLIVGFRVAYDAHRDKARGGLFRLSDIERDELGARPYGPAFCLQDFASRAVAARSFGARLACGFAGAGGALNRNFEPSCHMACMITEPGPILRILVKGISAKCDPRSPATGSGVAFVFQSAALSLSS
jgi:hypothetical protein